MKSRHLAAPLGAAFVLLLSACAGSPPAKTTADSVPVTAAAADPQLEALIDACLTDGYTYDKLGELCDGIGPRLVGSRGMAQAIEWSVRSMKEAGFDSVWTEPVSVPHWTRGREWARCTAPAEFDLVMTGLGRSVGTGAGNPDGIEAEILAVADFDELEARADEAPGRIVLFNEAWEGYGRSVQYRVHGASRAAAHGAVAALISSVTGNSLGAAHTGVMHYAEDQPRIPVAALTVEDAGRLFRMARRGMKPRVRLYMEAQNHPDTTSYNVIGDIRGRQEPEEIVLVSGHLDSWDVGTCAHDDGAGVALSLGAARMILQQHLRPRRTVRVVHWTSEEFGGQGGRAYLEAHRDELDRHVLAIESDSGAFAPRGFSVQADSLVVQWLANLAAPLARVAPDEWSVAAGGSGVDIGPIVRKGVPGAGHRVEHSRYFDLHHSSADTFDKIDADHLARNVAAIAGLVWLVAESEEFPRGGN